ncbi:MAG: hypothetical protein CVV56_02075 [Tenericutes bacterium HGW-Tenericutes-1]|jgi:hypothetical protein|nr:MAG: hypothetical protein CVV56_02075 [Tenericutes bacterium HGW-Tenericutes-1]
MMEIKMIKKYLDILGIPYDVDFTMDDIRSSYKTRSKFFHPDFGKVVDSEKKFIELKRAEEFLLDNYDEVKQYILRNKSSFVNGFTSNESFSSSSNYSDDYLRRQQEERFRAEQEKKAREERFKREQEETYRRAEAERKRKDQEERYRAEQEKKAKEEERLKKEQEEIIRKAKEERKRSIDERIKYIKSKIDAIKEGLFSVTKVFISLFANKKIIIGLLIVTVIFSASYAIGNILLRTPQIEYLEEENISLFPGANIEDLNNIIFLKQYDSCRLDDSNVNYNLIGEYKIDLICTDLIEKQMKSYNVVIKDDIPPTIEFLNEINDIEINEIALVNFLDYIDNIYDNYYQINDIQVEFELLGNLDELGEKEVIFYITDKSNNSSNFILVINVVDSTKPIMNLNYSNPIILEVGSNFPEDIVSISDNYDDDITFEINGEYNCNKVGEYNLSLVTTDQSGNRTSVDLTLLIQDTTPPIVDLLGNQFEIVEVGTEYIDANVNFYDNYDDNPKITFISNYNKDVVGDYYSEYSIEDSEGNLTKVTRYISVVDTTNPTINLVGNTTIVYKVGGSYSELGAIATDNYDSNPEIIISAPNFNFSTFGEYQVSYYAVDIFGNQSSVIYRTIIIEDNIIPTYDFNYIYTEHSTIIYFEYSDVDSIIINDSFFIEVKCNGISFYSSDVLSTHQIIISEMMANISDLVIDVSFNYDRFDDLGTLNVSENVVLFGTLNSPLLINVADDFRTPGFSYFSVELVSNVSLVSSLGSFYGKLDGNNYTISFIEPMTSSIFSYNYGSIKNISFSVESIASKFYTGGLFIDNYGLFENIYFSGNIEGSGSSSISDVKVYTAGFGINNYGTITNSSIDANVSSYVTAAGGKGAYVFASSFVIYNYGTISDCISSGIVSAIIYSGMLKTRIADADAIYNEGIMQNNTTTVTLRYE